MAVISVNSTASPTVATNSPTTVQTVVETVYLPASSSTPTPSIKHSNNIAWVDIVGVTLGLIAFVLIVFFFCEIRIRRKKKRVEAEERKSLYRKSMASMADAQFRFSQYPEVNSATWSGESPLSPSSAATFLAPPREGLARFGTFEQQQQQEQNRFSRYSRHSTYGFPSATDQHRLSRYSGMMVFEPVPPSAKASAPPSIHVRGPSVHEDVHQDDTPSTSVDRSELTSSPSEAEQSLPKA